MVHVVAGRAIEGEAFQLFLALILAQQGDGEAPADMGGIEQRAIGAVVDVEFLATAAFDAHDDRAIFRRQRAAGFAPQFRRVADRQAFETAMDRFEIIFERDRLHARIDRREAAAYIDDVDRNGCVHDRGAHALDRIAIGLGAHRLAADMEADAQRIGGLTGCHQQLAGFAQLRAELRCQAEFRMFG